MTDIVDRIGGSNYRDFLLGAAAIACIWACKRWREKRKRSRVAFYASTGRNAIAAVSE